MQASPWKWIPWGFGPFWPSPPFLALVSHDHILIWLSFFSFIFPLYTFFHCIILMGDVWRSPFCLGARHYEQDLPLLASPSFHSFSSASSMAISSSSSSPPSSSSFTSWGVVVLEVAKDAIWKKHLRRGAVHLYRKLYCFCQGVYHHLILCVARPFKLLAIWKGRP